MFFRIHIWSDDISSNSQFPVVIWSDDIRTYTLNTVRSCYLMYISKTFRSQKWVTIIIQYSYHHFFIVRYIRSPKVVLTWWGYNSVSILCICLCRHCLV